MSSKLFREDDVRGKTVIWSSGGTMGKVSGIGFGLDGSAFLLVTDEKGGETEVQVRKVMGVGEYVVVNREGIGGLAPKAPADQSQNTCKFCGATMPPDTVWCPNCKKAQH